MNNTQMTQFLVNSITKTYFKEVPHGLVRAGMIKQDTQQFFNDANKFKVHVLRFKQDRMLEVMMPGHARRAAKVEGERKRNREQINFYCRYVLAKQGKTIPFT